jgi:hypothetical protein
MRRLCFVSFFSDFLCERFLEKEAKSDNQLFSSLINDDNSDSSHFIMSV